MITVDELKSKLQSLGKSQEYINKVIAKFEQSVQNRAKMKDIARVTEKSYKTKIQELLADHFDTNDCRFFRWYPGLGIFVHREGDKAMVAFSFLNLNDVANVPNYCYDLRSTDFNALVNFMKHKFTYQVDWHGRSSFAAYDAFMKHHNEFPSNYKNLKIDIYITPKK